MGTRSPDERADDAAGRPTVPDLYQEDHQHIAVPVRHDGPVRTQTLPTSSGVSRNFLVTGPDPVKILNADPRRARAVVICTGAAIFIGPDKNAVAGSLAARWPVALALTITDQEAWYVLADAAGTSTVSVITSQWSD